MNCIFCGIKPENYILENEHFYVIPDKFPVGKGHSLVISKRHFKDYFEISDEESISLAKITKEMKAALDEKHSPSGYRLQMHCGESAGQTIFHFHLHIIPKY
ncbi:MAG: HIT family protein [Candidatus Cloacimonetes bacterium]|jgi:diadenosine tetraphosphate (Ap4A) HIT family hydrolase|nr:HIT family protein [Candidatus Cloacimonadota bacterium]